jgi:hypothetical protein
MWGRWRVLPERVMGWRGMVVRFHVIARQYEVKTQNKGVQGYWSSTQTFIRLRRIRRDTG